MDTTSPVVITSRAAEKDMNNIKAQHADILQGMSEQSVRVQANRQQKQADDSQKQQADRDYQLKQGELGVKRMSALI